MAFGPVIRTLRSAARGRALISVFAAAALTGLVSQPVLGHAVGKPFQSPIPLWMQLAGAGIAVAASFVVSGAIVTVGTDEPRYPHLAIPLLPSLVIHWLPPVGFVSLLDNPWLGLQTLLLPAISILPTYAICPGSAVNVSDACFPSAAAFSSVVTFA